MTMRYKPKTSPVIRATLAATEAVDRLHTTRLEEAKCDEERARIASQHHELIMTLMAILHEAQFGPPFPSNNTAAGTTIGKRPTASYDA
jgi:hypothetical protein